MVDTHPEWIEAVPTNPMTAVITIRVMRGIFATHGVPRVVVSDNGPCFISQEIESFHCDPLLAYPAYFRDDEI